MSCTLVKRIACYVLLVVRAGGCTTKDNKPAGSQANGTERSKHRDYGNLPSMNISSTREKFIFALKRNANQILEILGKMVYVFFDGAWNFLYPLFGSE